MDWIYKINTEKSFPFRIHKAQSICLQGSEAKEPQAALNSFRGWWEGPYNEIKQGCCALVGKTASTSMFFFADDVLIHLSCLLPRTLPVLVTQDWELCRMTWLLVTCTGYTRLGVVSDGIYNSDAKVKPPVGLAWFRGSESWIIIKLYWTFPRWGGRLGQRALRTPLFKHSYPTYRMFLNWAEKEQNPKRHRNVTSADRALTVTQCAR